MLRPVSKDAATQCLGVRPRVNQGWSRPQTRTDECCPSRQSGSTWTFAISLCLYGCRAPKNDGCVEFCREKCGGLGSQRGTFETPDTSRALKKARRGHSAPCLANHKRCNQRALCGGVFRDQAFQRVGELMDCIWRHNTQSFGQSLIGYGRGGRGNFAKMCSNAPRQHASFVHTGAFARPIKPHLVAPSYRQLATPFLIRQFPNSRRVSCLSTQIRFAPQVIAAVELRTKSH